VSLQEQGVVGRRIWWFLPIIGTLGGSLVRRIRALGAVAAKQ
jgi:hypothetical protein